MMCRQYLYSSTTLLFLFIFLTGGGAAAETIDSCDPDTDPYNCQCSDTLDQIGHCKQLSVSNIPDYTDPTEADLSFIYTTYDSERDVHVVHADLSQTPALGVMRPNSNNGQWESLKGLHSYLSDLLKVPLNSEGYLERFEYHQVGASERYKPSENVVLPSTKTFWRDAISDENGDVWVAGEIFDPYAPLGGTFCSYGTNQVWDDYDKDSLHALKNANSGNASLEFDLTTEVCAAEYNAIKFSGYFMDAAAQTQLHAPLYEGQIGEEPQEPTFQCDQSSSGEWTCEYERHYDRFDNSFRIVLVRMDELRIEQSYFRGGQSQIPMSVRTENDVSSVIFTRQGDYHWQSSGAYDRKDPVFDRVCGAGQAKFGNLTATGQYTKARLTEVENPEDQPVTCP